MKDKITLSVLKTKLKEIVDMQKQEGHDVESAHDVADQLLIGYINNKEVSKLYNSIIKWYA